MEYKRVLVINGQSMYKSNATGITLKSILNKWPKDNVLEMYISEDETVSEMSIAQSICVSRCFPILQAMQRKKNVIPSQNGVSAKAQTLTGKLKKRIRQILINIASLSPLVMSTQVNNLIEQFMPDVIYTLGGSVAALRLAVWVAEKYHIPIVLHIMDDWPHYLQDNEGLGQKLYHRQLQRWLLRCYKYVHVALAISPQMSKCYESETAIKHLPMMNSVNVNALYNKEKVKIEPFIFTYAGGLHLERWKALKDVAEAIEYAVNKTTKKAILRIYTSHEAAKAVKDEFSTQFVEFYDYVPHEKINAVYEATDALVHIEVMNSLLSGYFRFSISTKIPEYLSSNRPMLFYGPSNIGLYEYLQDNNCVYLAASKEHLCDEIVRMINGQDDTAIREQALIVARKNHSIEVAHKIFFETIEESCLKHKCL